MASHDQDILWTLASELIARQGPAAARRAMERSRELEQKGDASGAALWARVAEVVEKMLRPN
jgi:hypothetical protein